MQAAVMNCKDLQVLKSLIPPITLCTMRNNYKKIQLKAYFFVQRINSGSSIFYASGKKPQDNIIGSSFLHYVFLLLDFCIPCVIVVHEQIF